MENRNNRREGGSALEGQKSNDYGLIFEAFEYKNMPTVMKMPVLSLSRNNGGEAEIFPLYSQKKVVGSNRALVFQVGADLLSDALIKEVVGLNRANPCGGLEIAVNKKDREVWMRAVGGKVFQIKGSDDFVSALWTKVAENEALIINQGGVEGEFLLRVSPETVVPKLAFKNFLSKRLDRLLERRSQMMLDFGLNHQSLTELDQLLEEILKISDRFNLNIIERGELFERIEQTRGLYVKEVEKIAREIKEAVWAEVQDEVRLRVEAEVNKMKNELVEKSVNESKNNLRNQAILKRQEQEGLAKLHLEKEEDPELCKIVYKGPVFRLFKAALNADEAEERENVEISETGDVKRGKRKYSFTPFLLPNGVFGKHKTCVQEFKELIGDGVVVNSTKWGSKSDKSEHKLSDFMAALRYDASNNKFWVTAIDTNTRFKKKGTQGFSPFMQSTYEMEEGDVVKMGGYHLILAQNHGYSVKRLYMEAESQIEEMLEVIFDTETTTEAQDIEAYINIAQILECNLPKEMKDLLISGLQKKLTDNFDSLYKQVEAMTQGDAMEDRIRLFVPLVASLKVAALNQTLMPEFSATMERLREKALQHMNRFVLSLENTEQKERWSVQLMSIFPLGGRINKEQKSSEKKEKLWKNNREGVVEMVRLMELGLVKIEDLIMAGATEDIVSQTLNVLSVRGMIDNLYAVGSLEKIRLVQNLQSKCGNLRMKDVYGNDEIGIRNQNIEMSLQAGLLLADPAGGNSYVTQIAKRIAKKAWQKLPEKRSLDDRKAEMELIRTFMSMGILRPIHLVDFTEEMDPLLQEKMIEEKLIMAETAIADSIRNGELRKIEQEKEKALKKKILMEEHAKREAIMDQVINLVECLNRPKDFARVQALEDLMAVGSVANSKEVSEIVEVVLDGEFVENDTQRIGNEDGLWSDLSIGLKPLNISWAMIQREWKNQMSMAMKGFLGIGAEVDLQVLFDSKAMVVSDESNGDLGADKLEYLKLLLDRQKAGLNRSLPVEKKMDFLEIERNLDAELDSESRLTKAHFWMKQFLERIRRKDNQLHYFGLAKRLLKKYPEVADKLEALELALLQ